MKKGFTLIELLAVIVILAIILLIAVPQVLNVIDDVRRNSFKSSIKLIIKEIELEMTKDQLSYETASSSLAYVTLNNVATGTINELEIDNLENWQGIWSYDFTTQITTLNNVTDGNFIVNEIVKNQEYTLNENVNLPEITLNGDKITTVTQGSLFVEEGATAIDNNENNLTVNITGDIDESTIGNYYISYNAVDSNLNETTIYRTVKVEPININSNNNLVDVVNETENNIDLRITAEGISATNLLGTYGGLEVDSDSNGMADYFILYNSASSSIESSSFTSGTHSQKVVINDVTNGHGIRFNHNITSLHKHLLLYDSLFPSTNTFSTINDVYISAGSYDEKYDNFTGDWNKQIYSFNPNDTGSTSIYLRRNYSTSIVAGDEIYFDSVVLMDIEDYKDYTLDEYLNIFPNYFENTNNTNVTFVSEGKNILSKDNLENDSLDVYGNESTQWQYGFRSGFIRVEPNTNYFWSGFNSSCDTWHFEYDENYNFIKRSGHTLREYLSFTTSSTTHYIRLANDGFGTSEARDLAKNFDMQLEESNSITGYEEYQSDTHTINLESGEETFNLTLFPNGRIYKTVNTINTVGVNYLGR